MKEKKERTMGKRTVAAATAMTVVMAGSAFSRMGSAAATPQASGKEAASATTQSKFFCNSQALSKQERARHNQLREKMDAARKAVVETERGYEFQYRPSGISIAELAEWVTQEGKCCPFLDFHIDLENQGTLLCLRLTGEEGVKAFIRAEFEEASSRKR